MDEQSLRGKEHIIHAYSNRESHGKEAFTKDDTLLITKSTKNKLITITTPDNDGEPNKWNLSLDYGNGVLQVLTDKGQHFVLDCPTELFDVKWKHINFDCDDFNITGDTNIEKTLNVDGEVTHQKSLKVAKNVDAGKDVSCMKLKQKIPKLEKGPVPHPGHTW
jgi:hypothetical protein